MVIVRIIYTSPAFAIMQNSCFGHVPLWCLQQVVFNDKNTWANRQNHHPACISYVPAPHEGLLQHITSDVQDSAHVGSPSQGLGWCGRASRQSIVGAVLECWRWTDTELHWTICCFHNCSFFFFCVRASWALSDDLRKLHFQPVCPNVSVQPELKPAIIDELQQDLRNLADIHIGIWIVEKWAAHDISTQSISSNWVRLFLSERFSDFLGGKVSMIRQALEVKKSRHEAALKIQRCAALQNGWQKL